MRRNRSRFGCEQGRVLPSGLEIAVLAVLAVLVLASSSAIAQTETADAKPKLEVLGGSEARTVKVGTAAGNPSRLVGQIALLLRNASGGAADLRATFVAADGSSELRLPGRSKWVFLERIRASSTAPADAAMGKNEVRALRLRFSLPPGEPVSAVDGSLVLELDGETTAVAIAGAPPEFKDVVVRPKTIVLDGDESTATLTLSGPGVPGFLRRRGPSIAAAELYDGSGNSAKVTVGLPGAGEVVAEGNPYRAQATIELPDDAPPPGKYTGTLLLSDLSDALAVELDLRSNRSILCLIALALLGVLVGGLLSRLVALASRRSLLLKVLDESMTAYRYVLGSGGQTRSWRLEDLLDEPPSAASSQGTRLQGVPALRASIESARSSQDLDEDAARVLDTIARIQRWLRVEPVARRLALLAEDDDRGPLKSGEKWLRSRTWRDTQILLQLARLEPQSAAAADDLVARLLSQIEWHHRFSIAWDAVADLKGSEELAKIDVLLGDDGSVVSRKPELQDALDVRLEAFFEEELKGRRVRIAEPPTPREIANSELGLTPVRWDASANLFTGWATLDAPSYGQLSRRTATTSRARSRPSLRTEFNAINWVRDGAWTLASLALASAAYAVEAYDDTWGSPEDMATALLAGFAGKAVVDWAALPIFRSIRVRASGSTGAAAAAPPAAPASTPAAEPKPAA